MQPIIKGSRAKRKKENKENEPQKLAKLSRSVSKPEEEPTKDKVPAVKRAEVNVRACCELLIMLRLEQVGWQPIQTWLALPYQDN